jgi:hypothetical protein
VRTGGIIAGVIAILLVVVVLGAELAAAPVTARAARTAVERCVEVDELEVTSVARPAVVGLLQGELRDVRIRMSGLQAGDLRIDRVDARLPAAPVGLGTGPQDVVVVANVRIVEEDLERYLAARAPALASPTLAITPDGVEIGDERVPFTFDAAVTLDEDGDLRVVPQLGDPRLWSSLGLELELTVPPDIRLTSLDFADGEVVLSGRADIRAGVEGEPACPEVALLGAPAGVGPVGAVTDP